MPQIETLFTEAMQTTEAQISKDGFYQNLLNANEQYNKLVKDGIIKKRGFQLRGVEDTSLFNYSISASQ